MVAIKIVYAANIIVAGWVGILSLFYPKMAQEMVFSNTVAYSEVIRLVGCLWVAITVLSILGLWKPYTFSPVLLIQLIYKGTWLVAVALPALKNDLAFPKGMAGFFLVWVCILPFVIPWKEWINRF